MGIYYLQWEMHFQWKILKKNSEIDICKQNFGWLTYIHKKLSVMGMGVGVSVITTQPFPALTTCRENIPPCTALAKPIHRLCQSSSEICNSCSLISKTLNEYFYSHHPGDEEHLRIYSS